MAAESYTGKYSTVGLRRNRLLVKPCRWLRPEPGLPSTELNSVGDLTLDLEKPNQRPAIYVGSSTDKADRMASRFAQYDRLSHLSVHRQHNVANMLYMISHNQYIDTGYAIAHNAVVCVSPSENDPPWKDPAHGLVRCKDDYLLLQG